jgi:hypothetical protein
MMCIIKKNRIFTEKNKDVTALYGDTGVISILKETILIVTSYSKLH